MVSSINLHMFILVKVGIENALIGDFKNCTIERCVEVVELVKLLKLELVGCLRCREKCSTIPQVNGRAVSSLQIKKQFKIVFATHIDPNHIIDIPTACPWHQT